MKRLSILTFGALLAGLAACADQGPVAPPTSAPAFTLEEDTDAMPDSGEVVLHAFDDAPAPLAAPGESRLMALAPVRDIRIGVVQSAAAVTLGAAGSWELRDKANGLVLLTGAGDAATVTLDAAPPSFYRLQVVCGTVAAVGARKAAAEAAGIATFTEFVPAANCTRLYLGQFAPPPVNNFAARNTFRNQMIAQGHAGADSFWRVVSFGSTVYRVTRGATSFQSLNPVVLTSSTGIVTINGAPYRGKGEARVNGAGALAGVNELPVEEYLYGVVPRELGPDAFPEVEAQKAQAVAARTYALAGFNRRASDGYDLRATTDDQVYGGYAAEHPVSSAAVDATAGIAATYNGALISALFSSTSGGHTADSEESFADAVPYLRGVPDAERGRALEHVPSLEVFRAHANPMSLRAAKEGDFESDWARLHRWTFEWTMDEISSVISAFVGQPVGRVLSIDVVERGPSGRALRVEYVTEAGTFTSEKDRTRSALRFFNASGTPSNLPSTLFFVEPVRERGSNGATVGYRVYGGGFGHGVGLGQTGAVGMAQKGHTFDQILKHYYRGIDLTQWY